MRRVWLFALIPALGLAACGSAADQPLTTATTPTTATTTTSPTSAPTAPGAEGVAPVEVVEALAYRQGDERFADAESLVDVIAPTEAGPWPVVVAFHVHDLTRASMLPLATEIAARGRVVFVPDWGHPDDTWASRNTLEARFDLYTQEVTCAVAFAMAHAAEYGGDPDHVTIFGRFFGANAALMAGFATPDPLDACVESEAHAAPQAIVVWDAMPVLEVGEFDTPLQDNPEMLYSWTPWRLLDASHGFTISVVTEEDSGGYGRPIDPDGVASVFAYRHPDTDLTAELLEMGVLDDGVFSLRDSMEWAHQALLRAGYDTELILLPGSTPGAFATLSDEIRGLVVETVLSAERR